jgi:hypothetical protein
VGLMQRSERRQGVQFGQNLGRYDRWFFIARPAMHHAMPYRRYSLCIGQRLEPRRQGS